MPGCAVSVPMTARSRPRSVPRFGRGFTLVEILVVTVIIGIIVAFAGLSLGGRSLDDRLETEARRLEQLVLLAADEAQLRGEEVGFRYTLEGYEFLMLEPDGRWLRYDTGPLRARALASPVELELRVEGKLIPPAEVPAQAASEAVQGAAEEKKQAKGPGAEPSAPDEDAAKAAEAAKKAPQPQVFLLSSGEATPFVIDLRLPRHPSFFRLEGDMLGRVALARVQDRP